MKKKLKFFAVWFESSVKAKYLQLLLVTFAGAFSVFYTFTSTSNYKIFFAFGYIAALTALILFFVIVAIFYNRYGLNILVYHREAGVLFDKNLKIENVSLRRETLREIICFCPCDNVSEKERCLKDVGRKVGESFVRNYKQQSRIMKGGYKKQKVFLETILEYDSSSGMGGFSINTWDEQPANFCEIQVINPFTHVTGSAYINNFLIGYIEAILEGVITGRKFECIITTDTSFTVGLWPAIRVKAKEIH